MKTITKEVRGIVKEATVGNLGSNYKIDTETPIPILQHNVKLVYEVQEPETLLEFLNHTGIDESIIVEHLNKTYLK